MLKTRTWVVIILLLLACSAAEVLLTAGKGAEGTVANIYLDGVCVRSVDLSAVEEGFTFDVEGPSGTNRIAVEPGRIRVEHADCPDQICVQQGWISDSAAPIVCLPNRLVIRLEGAAAQASGIDTITK